jgi:solute carrier family 25 (mitochondrial phosphate transporter), member 3
MDDRSLIAAFRNPIKFTRINCDDANTDQKTVVTGGNLIQGTGVLPGDACEFGTPKFYALCGLGGMLSCGVAHTTVVPIALVKCRMQVDAAKYKSLVLGFKVTVAEEGFRALVKGWSPTFLGYSVQGFFKFGLYEVFKVKYAEMIGPEDAYLHRTSLYLAASASAEFFADIALAPFEAAKVKIQTTPGFATTLREAWSKMYAEEGFTAFYKGLVPLWMRQIPYTMLKFASFERTLEMLYKHVVPKSRAECTKGEQLAITFAAGYIAGVFCAIISHPADVLVSKLPQSKDTSVSAIFKKLGYIGMWRGLRPRIVMINVLTAMQWLIYDGVKVMLVIPRPPPPEMPDSLKVKLSESK